MPCEGAVQPERLPLPGDGVGAGAAGNASVVPPPADPRPPETVARRVWEQVPAHRRLEDLVGLMHHQRFGHVVSEVPGSFHVPIRATLHPLPGQAQLEAPRFRFRLMAHVTSPERIHRAGRASRCNARLMDHIAEYSCSTRRRVAASWTSNGRRITASSAFPAHPAFAFVLPSEPAHWSVVGGGHGFQQLGTHRQPTSFPSRQRRRVRTTSDPANNAKATCRH
jgi:hypothetical protein